MYSTTVDRANNTTRASRDDKPIVKHINGRLNESWSFLTKRDTRNYFIFIFVKAIAEGSKLEHI